MLLESNIQVKDYGDVVYKVDEHFDKNVPNMKGYSHVAACTQEVSKQVCNIIRDGRICLTLGGDHSIG